MIKCHLFKIRWGEKHKVLEIWLFTHIFIFVWEVWLFTHIFMLCDKFCCLHPSLCCVRKSNGCIYTSLCCLRSLGVYTHFYVVWEVWLFINIFMLSEKCGCLYTYLCCVRSLAVYTYLYRVWELWLFIHIFMLCENFRCLYTSLCCVRGLAVYTHLFGVWEVQRFIHIFMVCEKFGCLYTSLCCAIWNHILSVIHWFLLPHCKIKHVFRSIMFVFWSQDFHQWKLQKSMLDMQEKTLNWSAYWSSAAIQDKDISYLCIYSVGCCLFYIMSPFSRIDDSRQIIPSSRQTWVQFRMPKLTICSNRIFAIFL